MKRLSVQFMLVLVLVAMASFLAEAQTGKAGVRVLPDVEYASVDDHRLLLDLYLPEKVAGAPLLVWVHGGAWRGGLKSLMEQFTAGPSSIMRCVCRSSKSS